MRHVVILVVGLLATMMLISCDSPSFAEGEATALLMGELDSRVAFRYPSSPTCLDIYSSHDFFEKYQGNGVWLVEAKTNQDIYVGGRVQPQTPWIVQATWKVYERTQSVLTLNARRGC